MKSSSVSEDDVRRRRGVQREDVWAAADALLLAGEKPTIERVRQRMGSGSPNTVGPLLEQWFKHLGARLQDPGAFAAPVGVPDQVLQAARHFWETALAHTRGDFEERLREGLADAVANVEAEKERAEIASAAAYDASAKATRLQSELGEQAQALRLANEELAAERARLQEVRAALATEKERLIDERRRATEELAEIKQQLAAAAERADAADRRAALEIERERQMRAKAEKSTESVTKRFEETLRAQISASEQLTAVEDRLAQLKVDSQQRRLSLQALVDERDVRIRQLEAGLVDAQQKLAGRTAQEMLLSELVAKLGPTVKQVGSNDVEVTHASRRGSKRKRGAA
jgi:chromosome segregation ATPase